MSAEKPPLSSLPVVSNTTPLINLAGVGLLDLLLRLYGTVSIPQVVAMEYQAKAAPNDPDLALLPWLTIVDPVLVEPGLPKLGAGEAEAAAISLAKALPARLILLDERKARRIAAAEGLVVAGTLAVLVRAKRQGIIPAVRPVIAAMEAQGRYFGDVLIQRVLGDAGE